jgi:signal transduction histidine kinase
VAALISRAVPPEDVFAAVAAEVGRVVTADVAVASRYDEDGTVAAVGTWARSSGGVPVPVGMRVRLGGHNAITLVHETVQPARIDAVSDISGPPAALVRGAGFGSAVGVPIIVEGRLWGAVLVLSILPRSLPEDTEARLVGFTELVATAIASTQARVELRQYAEEQAALRRVATLVARAAAPEEVFAAVSAEVGGVLEADFTFLSRFDPAGRATIVGAWSRSGDDTGAITIGNRYGLSGWNVAAVVSRTGRAARVDDYRDATGPIVDLIRDLGIRSGVGVPIGVEGRLWGSISVLSTQEQPLRGDAEGRLSGFTSLAATAIADTLARVKLRRYAEEQAALRRVATLVARAAPHDEMFAAVAAEVGKLTGTDFAVLRRYDQDGTVTTVGGWRRSRPGGPVTTAPPRALGGTTLHARGLRRYRLAHVDDVDCASWSGADVARDRRRRATVSVPIHVEGRVWGSVAVVSADNGRLPSNTEERLTAFTELVGTSLAKAEAQAALRASRARIVAASDTTRRRIERDLHDGVQQHLVSLALQLREAQWGIPAESADLVERLDRVADGLTGVLEDIREIARGIHPAALAEGGLPLALSALARRAALPVRLDIRSRERFPEPVEIAAYYVVSEALTNIAKHAEATASDIVVAVEDGALVVGVHDDGHGGADPAGGSGLVGLTDRVEALGGSLWVHSPPGGGTTVRLILPLA